MADVVSLAAAVEVLHSASLVHVPWRVVAHEGEQSMEGIHIKVINSINSTV